MVWLRKNMFDLVLTMSVGILLRLIGAARKKRLCKKIILFKNPKVYMSWQKSYCCYTTFVSSNKLLSFLKGHFLFLSYKRFFYFSFVFVLCVCLSVTLCSFHLPVFLTSLPDVQYPKLLDIRNSWGKVMERSGLRFELFC